MILFQNSLLKLRYDPATDILFVDMPDITYDLRADFRRSLDIIVENTRNYDVKKLLVNASRSVIDMDTKDYTALITNFSKDLKSTRLQKVARVESASSSRERMVQKIIEEVQPVSFYRTFLDEQSAVEWLKSGS